MYEMTKVTLKPGNESWANKVFFKKRSALDF